MEMLSAEVRELYKMFSLDVPPVTIDMSNVRRDVVGHESDEELISFLRGERITGQFHEDKLPAKDDSLKQTSG